MRSMNLINRGAGWLTVDHIHVVVNCFYYIWCYSNCYCIHGYWYVIVDSIYFNFHSTWSESENMLFKLKLSLLHMVLFKLFLRPWLLVCNSWWFYSGKNFPNMIRRWNNVMFFKVNIILLFSVCQCMGMLLHPWLLVCNSWFYLL